MEKRIILARKIALFLVFIAAVMWAISKKDIIFYGAILIYVLIIIFTEKQMSDYVRNNPHKVTGRIIKEDISNGAFVLEYDVNGVMYTKRFLKNDYDNIDECKNKYLRIGDTIEIYTSIEIPSYALLSLNRKFGDKYLYTVIVVSLVLIILAFMGLFIVD